MVPEMFLFRRDVHDGVLGLPPVEVDLEGQHDHGDPQPDQGRDEHPAQRGQGDALRVVQSGTFGPEKKSSFVF